MSSARDHDPSLRCGVGPTDLTGQERSASSAKFNQRAWDHDAMTVIATHLRDNPAHPFSGRQCEEFVLAARDRLYASGPLHCNWCGEDVTGPCDYPNAPCGLYGAPDQSGCEATDAAQVAGASSRAEHDQ